MKRGMSLCAFRTNLPGKDVLDAMKQQGFDYVDVNAYSSREIVDREGRVHIEAAAEAYAASGLTVSSIHGPCVDLSSPDEEERAEAIRLSTAAMDALRGLGGSILVMHPGWPRVEAPADVRIHNAIESVKVLSDRCASAGVKLAVENLLPGESFNSAADILRIVKGAGGGAGICFDSCHASLAPEGLLSMIDALAPFIIATHLSDSFKKNDDHYPPGLGVQELSSVVAKLTEVGYKGVYNFELDAMSPKRLVGAVAKWVETIETFPDAE